MFLIIAAMYILTPLVFMFTASVMPAGDILKMPYRWIPKFICRSDHTVSGNGIRYFSNAPVLRHLPR